MDALPQLAASAAQSVTTGCYCCKSREPFFVGCCCCDSRARDRPTVSLEYDCVDSSAVRTDALSLSLCASLSPRPTALHLFCVLRLRLHLHLHTSAAHFNCRRASLSTCILFSVPVVASVTRLQQIVGQDRHCGSSHRRRHRHLFSTLSPLRHIQYSCHFWLDHRPHRSRSYYNRSGSTPTHQRCISSHRISLRCRHTRTRTSSLIPASFSHVSFVALLCFIPTWDPK